VLADPNDDDPRRVYADWLAERGDPRGEFIAVQCELARKFDFQLAVREHQLRREHGARWSAEIGVASHHVTFRRGFPERLELGVRDIAAINVARVPLRHLVVAGVREADVRRLVTLPRIPTLLTFGLRGAHLNAKAQRRLADVELFTTAPLLAFHGGRLNDASELAAMTLPALRALYLDGVDIRNLDVLARAMWMARLHSLQISRNHKFGVDYFLRQCSLPALTRLVIESPVLPSTLAALAVLPALEHLELPVAGLDMPIDGFATLKRFVVRGSVDASRLAALRERCGDRLVLAS
jgi:uncharacterized protein (TIGR02996 family)